MNELQLAYHGRILSNRKLTSRFFSEPQPWLLVCLLFWISVSGASKGLLPRVMGYFYLTASPETYIGLVREVILLLLLLPIVYRVAVNRLKVQQGFLGWAIISFWVVGVISMLNPDIPGMVAALQGFRGLCLFSIMYFWPLNGGVSSPNQVRKIVIVILALADVGAVFGLIQTVIGEDWYTLFGRTDEMLLSSRIAGTEAIRAFSIYDNIPAYGLEMGLGALVAAVMLINAKSRRQTIFALVSLGLCVSGMLNAFSKTAFISFGIVMLLIASLYGLKRKVIVAVVAGLILAFVIGNQLEESGSGSISQVWSTLESGSAWEERLAMWQGHIIPLAIENMPLGTGMGSTGYTSMKYGYPNSWVVVDNFYFAITLELGLAGLVIFIWLLSKSLLVFMRSRKIFRALGLMDIGGYIFAYLAAIVLYSFSFDVLHISPVSEKFWLFLGILAWSVAYAREASPNIKVHESSMTARRGYTGPSLPALAQANR